MPLWVLGELGEDCTSACQRYDLGCTDSIFASLPSETRTRACTTAVLTAYDYEERSGYSVCAQTYFTFHAAAPLAFYDQCREPDLTHDTFRCGASQANFQRSCRCGATTGRRRLLEQHDVHEPPPPPPGVEGCMDSLAINYDAQATEPALCTRRRAADCGRRRLARRGVLRAHSEGHNATTDAAAASRFRCDSTAS